MTVITKITNSYWDFLPYEIQELIMEFRDTILRSLSLEEIITALDYKYCDIITKSMNTNDHGLALTQVASSVYKVPGRIFRVSSYDIGDVFDGISLAINMERHSEDNENPEDPIVSYWDNIDEVQQGINAADCFDAMNVNDIEQLRPADDNDFIHFAEYCLDVFRTIYNNRESN